MPSDIAKSKDKKISSKLMTILTCGIFLFYAGSQIRADQTLDTIKNVPVENNTSPATKVLHKDLNIITIHNKGYEKYRKGPVNFYHESHTRQYKVNCWECHHDFVDGEENTWTPWGKTEKCSKCHDPAEKKDGVIKLQTAFHLNCKTCHRKMGIYKGLRESQTCGKCHVQELIIENDLYQEDKMGPVVFQHQKHVKTYLNLDGENIPCEECHHEYIDGKNTWKEGETVKNCGTSDCHDPLEKDGDKQVKLRTAYHLKCKVCHKDIAKSDNKKDAPYIKCSGCHLSSR